MSRNRFIAASPGPRAPPPGPGGPRPTDAVERDGHRELVGGRRRIARLPAGRRRGSRGFRRRAGSRARPRQTRRGRTRGRRRSRRPPRAASAPVHHPDGAPPAAGPRRWPAVRSRSAARRVRGSSAVVGAPGNRDTSASAKGPSRLPSPASANTDASCSAASGSFGASRMASAASSPLVPGPRSPPSRLGQFDADVRVRRFGRGPRCSHARASSGRCAPAAASDRPARAVALPLFRPSARWYRSYAVVVRAGREVHRAGRGPTLVGGAVPRRRAAGRGRPARRPAVESRRRCRRRPPVDRPRPRKLQRHPIVGLHGRVAAVLLHLGRSADQQRHQQEGICRVAGGHVAQQRRRRSLPATRGRARRGGVSIAAPLVPISSRSPSPTSHIVDSGNTDAKVRTIDLQIGGTHVVGVRPLADDAVRLQPRARRLEELPREQRRDAGHPRIGRFRDDHVVAAAGERQMRSAVADDQVDARDAKDAAVLSSKNSDAFTTSGEISTTSARRDRAAAPAPSATVTPLPRPRTRRSRVGDAAGRAAGRAAAASACRPCSTRRPFRRSPAIAGRPVSRTLTVAAAPSSWYSSRHVRTVRSRGRPARCTARTCRRRRRADCGSHRGSSRTRAAAEARAGDASEPRPAARRLTPGESNSPDRRAPLPGRGHRGDAKAAGAGPAAAAARIRRRASPRWHRRCSTRRRGPPTTAMSVSACADAVASASGNTAPSAQRHRQQQQSDADDLARQRPARTPRRQPPPDRRPSSGSSRGGKPAASDAATAATTSIAPSHSRWPRYAAHQSRAGRRADRESDDEDATTIAKA